FPVAGPTDHQLVSQGRRAAKQQEEGDEAGVALHRNHGQALTRKIEINRYSLSIDEADFFASLLKVVAGAMVLSAT
ncbi:hypothetical protein, partial [Pseudomonas agarici]|uniref:hypothetical protein n=1 Tax=Pseudomonas agarici TaxID=46677 RepID=UPI001B7FDEE7